MELKLVRQYRKEGYTIGKLFIDGEYFCDTLEDTDRGLDSIMPEEEINRRKVYGKTCIPYGTYKVCKREVSPKFRSTGWAKKFGGAVPRLLSVKGYSGILIHPGNTADDTLGCILVGDNKAKGKVLNSQATWLRLMERLWKDEDGFAIIKIVRP